MRTVGEILKKAREEKRYSLYKLEERTKIKKEYIEAIEKEQWEKLPEFTVVSGFVKNIAAELGVDEKETAALLRRDYPPKDVTINPKPDVKKKFTWSPRITFITSIIIVMILILGYLGFQYTNFIKPPKLEVYEPQQGAIVESQTVNIVGMVDPESTVVINNQPILINEDGNFEVEIDIGKDTKDLVVVATSRSGKETIVRRDIVLKQD